MFSRLPVSIYRWRIFISTICSLCILLSLYAASSAPPARKAFFHLLIPATRTNKELCRLLLSTAALEFPSPCLINWAAHEEQDPYVQHVAKVGAAFDYLQSMPRERDDDLVLLVDGYDVWFQLRPEVMISRYYEVVDAADERLAAQMGLDAMYERGIYQSVVFGPDKICWPENPRRTACWAVPESTLPPFAFGPETDSGRWREHYRARWLNSGTVMGPVRDVRALLEATALRIARADTEIVSDQFHVANIFGEQEYARKVLSGEEIPLEKTLWLSGDWHGGGHFENVTLEVPEMLDMMQSEYHIAIDYESKLFQTNAYYSKYLGWVAYDGVETRGRFSERMTGTKSRNLLAADIASSPPPFSPMRTSVVVDNEELPTRMDNRSRDPRMIDTNPNEHVQWEDLELGTNVITGQVFPVLHFTPPKEFRDRWWNRMWYFPYGRAIIAAAKVAGSRQLLATADIEWWTYEAGLNGGSEAAGRLGGAWTDGDNWMTWDDLCADHQAAVFYNEKEVLPEEVFLNSVQEVDQHPTEDPRG